MFSASKFLVALLCPVLMATVVRAEETWPDGTQFLVKLQSGSNYQVFAKEPGQTRFETMTAEELKAFPLIQLAPVESSVHSIRLDAASIADPLAKRELSLENFKEFWELVNGTSKIYMKASDAGTAAIPVCGIRSITAGAGLTGGTITTVGTIALENFGTAGTYYKVTTDIKGRVKSGVTSLSEADIPTLTTAGKVSGSAIISGVIGGNTSINTTGNLTTTGAVTAGSLSVGALNVTTLNASAVNTTTLSATGAATVGSLNSGAVKATAINADNLTTTGVVKSSSVETGSVAATGAISAATLSAGSLTATGAINGASVTATGTVSANSVSARSISTSGLKLLDSGNAHQIGLNVATNSAAYNLTLPTALPSDAGQVLTSDSSGQLAWTNLPSPGQETNVQGILPIVVTASGSSRMVGVIAATENSAGVVTLAKSGGTSSNTVVQANDPRLVDARPPGGAAFGDLNGTYPAPRVSGLRGIEVSSTTPTDGQVLKFTLAQQKWAAGSIGLTDLKSAAGLTQIPSDCSASQTMLYSSVTDQLICASIAISHTAVSGLGDAALLNVGTAAGTVASGDDARFGNALKLQGRAIANQDPNESQVLTWNAAASRWEPQTLPAGNDGTLVSITAGHGLTGGTITTSGTISVNAGTSAGQIVELDSSARLPAVDGSQLSNVNTTKLQGRAVSSNAPNSSEVLKFNGTQWTPAKINLADLRSTASGALFPAPNCSASQSLTWSPALDQFICQSIAVTDSSLSWGSKAANTFFAGPNGSAGAPQFRMIAAADLPAGAYDNSYFKNGGNSFGTEALLGTNDNNALGLKTAGALRLAISAAGQVGINTNAPQAALDVNGAVKVGNDDSCTSAKAGSLRWTGTAFQGCDGSQWSNLAGAAPVEVAPAAYAYQVNSTNSTYSAAIPWADSVPTNTQGSEVMTATITPTSANSLIEVSLLLHYSQVFNKSRYFTVAAFQDSSAAAFATSATSMPGTNCSGASDTFYICQANLSTVFVAGKTTPITIRIRAGGDALANWEVNGSGGRKLGGSLQSTLVLREVKR